MFTDLKNKQSKIIEILPEIILTKKTQSKRNKNIHLINFQATQVVKEKEEICGDNTTHKGHTEIIKTVAPKITYGEEKYERSVENDIGRSNMSSLPRQTTL